MIYRISFFIICFLIVACDLPNEADKDCNGDSLGTAYIDDCGRCVGGNTHLLDGQDKDSCGECFGVGSLKCNDPSAINFFDVEDQCIDNDMCIYDLCLEYLPDNQNFNCNQLENDGSVYEIGEQLHCDDIDNQLNICFPDCSNGLTLSDFYGKVMWIEITASW